MILYSLHRILHILLIFFEMNLYFVDLDIDLFVIANARFIHLAVPVGGNTNELLNLNQKSSENIILNILIDMHHVGWNLFDLRAYTVASLVDEPR